MIETVVILSLVEMLLTFNLPLYDDKLLINVINSTELNLCINTDAERSQHIYYYLRRYYIFLYSLHWYLQHWQI